MLYHMTNHEEKLAAIILNLKKFNPDFDVEQESLLRKAFEFAQQAHAGQKRLSGEDYIVHSLATAKILSEMHFDPVTVTAGILHDVPEDTEIELEEIKRIFGKEIAGIVRGITKLSKVKYRGMERYAENLRKMFVAMATDIRTVVIKFCDRIHNLQTLQHQPPHKALRIAKESMEIYAPIANRLGLGEVKGKLEDLAFPYVYPQEHAWVKSVTKDMFKHKEKVIDKAKKTLIKSLREENITDVIINSRVKNLYSLYLKLMTHDKNLDRIYDLIAMRIIVKDIKDCYAVLGLVHTLWTPLKGRIKDYIAQPKPNNYQSLHTSVFTDEGEVLEIQIRTQEMHDYAEYGIAAHWQYSEKRAGTLPDSYREWINNLLDWQKEIADSNQYLENLQKVRLDFFRNRIFVFTPKGDVIDLPEDATPIDFAYHIHTDVGNRCSGAIINNNQASLSQPLKSGDIVTIITNDARSWPNPDWLQIVKTTLAREKIKEALRKQHNALSNKLRNKFNRLF
ncbi:MAG: RelA/SpoT family protein [Candidatus Komeilibacteria bacterium]|nr:RelA/SpoT family protein [Candidatus Komeilibacteria bacterium]